MLKKFLCDIKYSESDIFQDSFLNVKNFMSTVTKLSYDWEIFYDLRRKYNSGNIFVKNSKLKEKLDLVEMETKTLADLLCKITDIKVNNSMNPFVMSQTYLRKAELISKCIVTSATLSRNINDRNVGLRRRINQQRSNSSAYSSAFHGNKD